MARKTATKDRPKPSYLDPDDISTVDELPEDITGGRGGKQLHWYNLLNPIVESGVEGEWVEVATYPNRNGAGNAVKVLTEEDRPLPEGEWEFAARKVSEGGSIVSKLFAKYAG